MSSVSLSAQRKTLPEASVSSAAGSGPPSGSPPKNSRVPFLSVTSHQYDFGSAPCRTILRNEPSTRWWKTFSAVRGTAGPLLATGVSSCVPSMYVSVSLAGS